jgi:Na+/H+ antiporter NhaD/arsenite permease-like protein
VAVVVGMPVALRVAHRAKLPGSSLAVAIALTANATSFLLPTSNLTTLLVLSRSPLPTSIYLRGSWVAWVMVTAMTVAGLAFALAGRPDSGAHAVAHRQTSSRAVLDLGSMFLGASAVRAILGVRLSLSGGFVQQLASGTLFAAGVNNLPAAAAVHSIGTNGTWAAVLAMAIGPNVFITGSVATLICRRIARDGGVKLGAARFSALGLAIVPVQMSLAVAGLHLTGALR